MKEGKIRKFDDTQGTDRQTVQRLRTLYPLWILEGAGQYYNLRKNKRKNSKITTIYRPKSEKLKNHFIYKGIHIYNTLPTEIKSLPVNTFGKRITQYVHSNCVWDSAD